MAFAAPLATLIKTTEGIRKTIPREIYRFRLFPVVN